MDRELQILREAALISMAKKAQMEEAAELAALREAALDSARERRLSSDLLRKRRLESPPSHHYPNRISGDYESYESDEGDTTPKMTEGDSAQNTPPPRDNSTNTVFTIKVTDKMLLKRSSSNSDDPLPGLPIKEENDKITIKLTTEQLPPVEMEQEKEVRVEAPTKVQPVEKLSTKLEPDPTPLKPTTPQVIKESSPAFSKVSSADELPVAKKLKKKHKKKKTNKSKRQKHTDDVDPPKDRKIHPKDPPKQKKHQNGHTEVKEVPKPKPLDHPKPECKAPALSELDRKVDENIEILQRAKRLKQENKGRQPPPPKKIISEELISSAEEEELLREKKPPKSERKRSASPPRSGDRREGSHKRSKDHESNARSDAPSPDLSVSLKSKREFEQMKAELNKTAPKKKEGKDRSSSYRSPRKERSPKRDRSGDKHNDKHNDKHSDKHNDKHSDKHYDKSNDKHSDKSGDKSREKSSDKPEEPRKEHPSPVEVKIDKKERSNDKTFPAIPSISEMEELMLLGPDEKTEEQKQLCEDFVSVMKEDSFSDSDKDENVNIVSADKKSSADLKKKKGKKDKKKKRKEGERRKKKKRKKQDSDSDNSSISDDDGPKKPKVKIDKSELNKIVQFLKQRDEAQKTVEGSGKNAVFNPKIISKDTKPIEIKIKSKPKR